jgi:hypothetical protein
VRSFTRRVRGSTLSSAPSLTRTIAGKAEKNRLKPSTVYGDQHRLCLEGTRNKTRAAIHEWIDDQTSAKKIFYLLDVPGSGKSTVSKQLFKELEQKKRLVGRFFFSRDTEDTMSIRLFCSAVWDAFASQSQEFEGHTSVFKKRPDFTNLSFEEQLEGLVVAPLRLLNQPAVLIVDAVDECNNDYGWRDRLLDALHTTLSSEVPLLRIFITGRPEKDIKRHAENSGGYRNFRQLEGENTDVEQYISSRLQDLPEDERLVVVRGADGLFIWARTACDLLLDADDRGGLLEGLGGEVSLIDLYKIAMKQAMPKDEPSRRAILATLGMILAAQRPLSIEELKSLSQNPGVVESVVSRLGSFLVCDGPDDPIRLVHITFRDFITNRLKAGAYFVQLKLGHYVLASQCLIIIDNTTIQRDFRANKLERDVQKQVIEVSIYNY